MLRYGLSSEHAPRRQGPLWRLTALLSGLLLASTTMAMPVLQYSQDGQNFQPITVLASAMKAARYYDYRAHSGHPAFGIAKGKDTICLYWDTTDQTLSLIFISGGHEQDRASGNVSLKGLPSTATLAVSDDPGEFKWSSRTDTLTGHYFYQNSTDGFVMSGLEAASFDSVLKLSQNRGIKSLRLAVGDPNAGGSFQSLDLSQPFYLRTVGANAGPGNPVIGAGVPEPTGFAALSLITALLFKRPRRAT